MLDQRLPPSRIRSIRERLGMSQADLAKILGRTQGNIGHYEIREQVMPPQVAQRLIFEAAVRGHRITYDDIYGPVQAIWAKAEVKELMQQPDIEEGENK